MSACDTCSKPGSCCTDFHLIGRRGTPQFKADAWEHEAQKFVDRYSMPFKPLRIDPNPANEVAEGHVTVRYTCPKLTPEGRCGDYENRPQLCRSYEPMQDRLCAMHPEGRGDD